MVRAEMYVTPPTAPCLQKWRVRSRLPVASHAIPRRRSCIRHIVLTTGKMWDRSWPSPGLWAKWYTFASSQRLLPPRVGTLQFLFFFFSFKNSSLEAALLNFELRAPVSVVLGVLNPPSSTEKWGCLELAPFLHLKPSKVRSL